MIVVKKMVGVNIGNVTFKKSCHRLAPSMRAASEYETGIPLQARQENDHIEAQSLPDTNNRNRWNNEACVRQPANTARVEHGTQNGIEQAKIGIQQKRPDHAYSNRTRDKRHEVEHTIDRLSTHVINTSAISKAKMSPPGYRNDGQCNVLRGQYVNHRS